MNIEVLASAAERAVLRFESGDEAARIPTVLYGLRLLSSEEALERLNPYAAYQASMDICDLIAGMTPRQFAQMFPIQKVYDGSRRGLKDYFSTIEMIERRGWDTPIENAVDFLWEYKNDHVTNFIVNTLIWAGLIRESA